MVDSKSSYSGEAKVWDSLKNHLPDNIVVYNNREISGREFDFCLLLGNRGILIIEVKGWLSSKIKVHGIDEIEVEGYEKFQRSPKKQARAYRFALLNKFVDKYNVSPLIFDMVCYPFISKAEYEKIHLNIISEENFTIFKEDIEDGNKLQEKINKAYECSRNIPHADFTDDLIIKFRQNWEPDFEKQIKPVTSNNQTYSILSVYSREITKSQIVSAVNDYFSGTKIIMFVGVKHIYQTFIETFDDAFRKRNIQPSSNSLDVGYKTGFVYKEDTARTFNLEIYYIPHLSSICQNNLVIHEGRLSASESAILAKIAKVSSFNLQQFMVEHASSEKNTLVEAGAGTGKTFSMVSRVAYLCNKSSNAVTNISDEIVMVTFTNPAAENMKRRLKQMFLNYFVLTSNQKYLKFIEDTDRAHISTIDSFVIKILRTESIFTGMGTNFHISSDELLRENIYDIYLGEFLKEKEADNPNFTNEIPVPIYELKKKLINIADSLMNKSVDFENILPSSLGVTEENSLPYFNELISNVVFKAEREYSGLLRTSNRLDLKECITLMDKVLELSNTNIDFLKMRYLFIDESQDTDDAQIKVFQMLQKACTAECRLFVVGDLKQSIYRFRGAKLSAFSQLKNGSLYEWETFYLNTNYRTDYRLLDKFDSIFKKMAENNFLPYSHPNDRLRSQLQTSIDEDNLLVRIPCHANDVEKFAEAFLGILDKQIAMTSKLMENHSLSKEERTIAILVRNNWQVEKLVNIAKKHGLNIETKSGGNLFQLPSTIDLYKLLLALNNSSNPIYLVNFIESNYTDLSLNYQTYRTLSYEDKAADLTRILDEFFISRMGKSWKNIVNDVYSKPILYMLKQIYDALAPWKQYSRSPDKQRHYMANYEYLIEIITRRLKPAALTLNTITEYLKVNILTGQQQLSRDIDANNEGVNLICTTIHKSKGLEFGTVILPYTDENISDMKKVKTDASYSEDKLAYFVQFNNGIREYNSNYDICTEGIEQISEESRILYVALTRAIRNCVWIDNLDRNPGISWSNFMRE